MADPDHKAQMKRLETRIAEAKAATQPKGSKIEEHHSQAHLAWRMVIGFGLGYGLDSLFGTLPIFLVVMTLLGFVAGVRTMLRSAEEVQREAAGEALRKDEE